MGKKTKDLYLETLRLVNLSELAKETGRAYRTLQSYRRGERGVSEAAVRELIEYLQKRSDALESAAEALSAALDQEEDGE